MIIFRFRKIELLLMLLINLFISLASLEAFEARDYLIIDTLVRSCYKDNQSCNSSLYKIHNYQKSAAKNKKFSCQTRLLGLEANLIMAINSNLKTNEVKNIIQAVKKYC